MRKIFKILLVVVIIAVVSLCINNVFADNRPEVIKYERDYDHSAVLYSDGQLYLWGYRENENFDMKLTDVKDYSGNNLYEVHLFIDSEHNLKMIQNNYIWNSEVSEGHYEYSTSEVIMTNAKKIVGEYVLTNDNKLYKY